MIYYYHCKCGQYWKRNSNSPKDICSNCGTKVTPETSERKAQRRKK